jgi:hypothetical protein
MEERRGGIPDVSVRGAKGGGRGRPRGGPSIEGRSPQPKGGGGPPRGGAATGAREPLGGDGGV